MTTSKGIAALIGPTLIVVSASMLLNLGTLPALIARAADDAALILMSGIILFVAGLAIVRAHNRWSGGWPVVVTILGWLFLLGGLARTLFFNEVAAAAAEIAHNSGFIIGEAVVLLALGAFLSLKAYREG